VIVVDTNILAYLYLPGPHSAKAEALLRKDAEWKAPVLWRSEFLNILAGFMRRKDITFDEACALQGEAQDLMDGAEFAADPAAVLALVRDSDCSAYDCEFIALATQLETRLVTLDAKILRAFPGHAVAL
jgi:predicted nucleic acid-binding protein